MSRTILITDGEQRASLAAVRSLGRAGFVVHVCSFREGSLAGASRFARSSSLVPDPLSEPGAHADAVSGLARRLEADLVLPITDAAILSLLPVRNALGRAIIPMPELDTYLAISDKARILAEAAGLGIDVPRQVAATSRGEAVAAVDRIRFPVVLKPARSIGDNGSGRVKLAVRYAADAGALGALLAELPEAAFPCLLQERIVGPGLGVFLLLWEDRVLARFAHRRLREKPPSGGVSVRAESVPLDLRLVEQAERLLRRFHWRGVAMVEFKLDQASGRTCLMEVNGRLWGSLQLAIHAGVDFPRLLVDAALNRAPAPVEAYRVGLRARWWWGEVDHVLARARRSASDLALPAGQPVPSPLAVAVDVLRAPLSGVRGDVFQWRDPKPALRETLDWLRGR